MNQRSTPEGVMVVGGRKISLHMSPALNCGAMRDAVGGQHHACALSYTRHCAVALTPPPTYLLLYHIASFLAVGNHRVGTADRRHFVFKECKKGTTEPGTFYFENVFIFRKLGNFIKSNNVFNFELDRPVNNFIIRIIFENWYLILQQFLYYEGRVTSWPRFVRVFGVIRLVDYLIYKEVKGP